MDLKPTKESLDVVRQISSNVSTFHHHYHILYDVAKSFSEEEKINYLEIGAYAGASSCLMLQRPNTTVISIDLGEPISKGTLLENILKYKNNSNYYQFIQGDSQSITVMNEVFESLSNSRILGYSSKVDILFIDGDHKYDAVKSDFRLYSPLVRVGGYIIFDDYNDSEHSPEVKKAVDELIPSLLDYEIIGTFKNELGAYPEELVEGNCFVIKKIS